MIRYFTPNIEQNLLEKQKGNALIWMMLSLFVLLIVLVITSLLPEPNFSASDYFLFVGMAYAVTALFILKKYGFRHAGNFTSFGALLITTIVLNIYDEETLMTKYGHEFYIAIFVLVLISLFSTRRILIFSAIVLFLSAFRAYYLLGQNFPEQSEVINEMHIFFSFSLINSTLILFFTTKFADKALENANQDAMIKQQQNLALVKERERAEASELLYRNIVNNLTGGIYKTDANNKIVLVSPSTSRIMGYDESYFIGKNLEDVFEREEEKKAYFESMEKDGRVELFKAELKTKDRGLIYVETNARMVLNKEGDYNGIEGIIYDVTEQRKMQIELDEHRNNLEMMVNMKTEELEASLQYLKDTQTQLVQSEKMASLGILTAGVAHELNNPLNFIQGSYIGMEKYFKEKDISDETLMALFNSLQTGVERAAEIVKGLNQFSRSKDTQEERCNIPAIIENCLLILRNNYKDRIEIKRSCEQTGMTILGNVGKLHQVFVNVLTNAIQAIEDEGEITVSAYRKKDELIVEISDTGHGISPGHLSKITDPFFTTKDPGKGTGLGLAITYTIIKDHKGSLDVNSEENKGTTVVMKFPAKDV